MVDYKSNLDRHKNKINLKFFRKLLSNFHFFFFQKLFSNNITRILGNNLRIIYLNLLYIGPCSNYNYLFPLS